MPIWASLIDPIPINQCRYIFLDSRTALNALNSRK